MKIGIQHIEDIIFSQLRRAGYAGGNLGYSKFAKDTAKLIYERLDDEVKANRDWNVIHNFPQDLEPIVRRLERGLHCELFPRTAEAEQIYRWIIERESEGQGITQFVIWANQKDRVKYIGKYRKVENIRADWPQAFISSGPEMEII